MNYIIEQEGNEHKAIIKSANYPYFTAFANFKEANQNEVIIKLPTHIPHLNARQFNVLALSLENKPINEILTDEEFYSLSQVLDFLCVKHLTLNLLMSVGKLKYPTQYNNLVLDVLRHETSSDAIWKFYENKSFILECDDLFDFDNFDWNGIICAGGAILSHLNVAPRLSESDIDLFILNNDQTVLKRTLKFFEKPGETIFVKRANVITIIRKGQRDNIQLILCPESYPEHVLKSFDSDYVKAYTDGKYLIIDGECLAAWITRTIKVYHRNISHSRIYKALRKGFTFDSQFVFYHPEIPSENFLSYLADHPLVTKYAQKYYYLDTTTSQLDSSKRDEIAQRFLTKPGCVSTDYIALVATYDTPSLSTETFIKGYVQQKRFDIPMELITTDLIDYSILDVTGIVIANLSIFMPGVSTPIFQLYIKDSKTMDILKHINNLIQADATRQGMNFYPIISSNLTYNGNPVETVRIKVLNDELLTRAINDIGHNVKINATLLLNCANAPANTSVRKTYTRLALVDYSARDQGPPATPPP